MRRSTTEKTSAVQRESMQGTATRVSVTGAPVDAYIGIGANLGDARGALDSAFDALAVLPRTELLAASSIYRSAPIDSSGPDYLNAVIKLRTGLDPDALLGHIQRIELQRGRKRPYRNAPRTLDLDLLLYADRRIDSPALTVPHPRMHERAFVLAPLSEIEPQLKIPGVGAVAELLELVAHQRIDRL
jgi:2-amino-4-hydroxy-6-hydroxymethyldihydropteridine diphosphokinase